MSKINVLCLHGAAQNVQMFQNLLAEYIRIGEANYNLRFFFTQAKYPYPEGSHTTFDWYPVPLDVSTIGKQPYDSNLVAGTMFDIDNLVQLYDADVLLGLSQGGNVVDTYFEYVYTPRKNQDPSLKTMRAVIMSGYSFVDLARQNIDVLKMSTVSPYDVTVPMKYDPIGYKNNLWGQLGHGEGHTVPTSFFIIILLCHFMQTGAYPLVTLSGTSSTIP